MAKKDMKAKYQGPKTAWDVQSFREELAKRRERAETNAQGRQTNAVFATTDTEFIEACNRSNVEPSPRQASKFRNGYGKAARELGRSRRRNPEAR